MIDSQHARLLLVEPEEVLADLASFRLELLGYQMQVVSSGLEAMDHLRRDRFDLMIVNTNLPEGDGVEWLTQLRLEIKADALPAMMFSLDPSLETVRRAYLAGAQDYLITPFDPTVLEEKVRKLLHGPTLVA